MSHSGVWRPDAAYARAIAVLLISGLCINAYFLWVWRHGIREGYADFTSFYSAGTVVRSGQGRNLYREEVQYLAQVAAAPGLSARQVPLPYLHLPFEALIFVPIACLPYLTGYMAWAAVNVFLLFVSLRLLRPKFPDRFPLAAFFVSALIFFPVFITISQGQDVLLFLVFAAASYSLAKRRSDFRAGFSLGLGLFRPELAVPMALLVMFARGKRFTAGFFAAAASLILVSASVVGWSGLLAYPKFLSRMERIHGHGSIIPANMPNIRGLTSLVFHDEGTALIATIAISAALLAVSLWKVWWSPILCSTEQIFCVAVLCALLVSFHGLKHDLSLLMIPFVFICSEWAEQPALNLRSQVLLLWPALFFFCTPLLVFLWLVVGKFCLAACVLVFWLGGVLFDWPASGTRTHLPLAAQA